jgi:hypothetical protein
MGKFDDAVGCLQRVLLVKQAHNDDTPESNRAVFMVCGQLGELYVRIGNAQLAKDLLLKVNHV